MASTDLRDHQTAVEFHGDFAVIRWDFAGGRWQRFYTVRDTTTGRDSRSWKQLRNARKQARAAAHHRAEGHDVALAALGWSR